MSDKYDDMIDLQRPVYDDLPPMPLSDRAAQFSPFAAVVGYGDAVEETARFTDSRIVLQEDKVYELNKSLEDIRNRLDEHPVVELTYFVPDKLKAGGKYNEYRGIIKKVDDHEGTIIFEDGVRVPIDDIVSITGDV